MTQRQNELLVRWAIFTVVGVVLFLLMNPLFYRTRIRSHSTVNLSDVGVSIQTGGDPGTTVVRVDDREETIPTGKLGSTALSKEAMERVASNTVSLRRGVCCIVCAAM